MRVGRSSSSMVPSASFELRRQTGLKHARVAVLVTMGTITTVIAGKLPGCLPPSMGLEFVVIPNGLAAIAKVPSAGWAQILVYGPFCEFAPDQSPGTSASQRDFSFKV